MSTTPSDTPRDFEKWWLTSTAAAKLTIPPWEAKVIWNAASSQLASAQAENKRLRVVMKNLLPLIHEMEQVYIEPEHESPIMDFRAALSNEPKSAAPAGEFREGEK